MELLPHLPDRLRSPVSPSPSSSPPPEAGSSAVFTVAGQVRAEQLRVPRPPVLSGREEGLDAMGEHLHGHGDLGDEVAEGGVEAHAWKRGGKLRMWLLVFVSLYDVALL